MEKPQKIGERNFNQFKCESRFESFLKNKFFIRNLKIFLVVLIFILIFGVFFRVSGDNKDYNEFQLRCVDKAKKLNTTFDDSFTPMFSPDESDIFAGNGFVYRLDRDYLVCYFENDKIYGIPNYSKK